MTRDRIHCPPSEKQATLDHFFPIDAALQDFLALSAATLIGNVLKYPSSHAIATARAGDTVFTVEIMPGTDAHRRAMPRRDA